MLYFAQIRYNYINIEFYLPNIIFQFYLFCSRLFSGETGETGKASTPQSTAIKETDQLTLSAATVNQAVNQANFQTNPVQSYVASQPYYNPYTGKGVTSQSIKRPTLRSVPSFTSREATTINRYSTGFRTDILTKGRQEKPLSRQLQNKKIFPVSASGTIPLSTVENIPILKSYKGSRLVISSSNSYLLHKLFPFANSNFLRKNNNELKQSKPSTPYRYPSKAFTQNRFLTNSIYPSSHKERIDVTSHPVQTSTVRNRFRYFPQANALAGNRVSYGNRNTITSSSPSINGYPKGSTFFNDGITHTIGHPKNGQASANLYSSYLRPQVKLIPNRNFQITQESLFKPVSTTLAKDAAFRSPMANGFYPHPVLWGKGGKIDSVKVVTEGELKEKGLLSDILSRDHIRHKSGKMGKGRKKNRSLEIK